MIKSIWHGDWSYLKVFLPFVLISKLGAGLTLIIIFLVLCQIDCSALPWFSLVIGGAINILFFFPISILLAVGAWRSANRFRHPKNIIGKAAIPAAYLLLPGLNINSITKLYQALFIG